MLGATTNHDHEAGHDSSRTAPRPDRGWSAGRHVRDDSEFEQAI
jgi:hypothetical protein